MHKNRFVRLMNTFSDYDMKQFERFIHSPYHNRSQQCVDVFNSLKYYLFEVPGINFTKAELCVSVFKDTKKINTLEVILSKLTKLAEGFIVIERLNRQPYIKQHLLLEELLERQNLEYSRSIITNTINRHETIKQRGEQFYFEHYLLIGNRYSHTILLNEKNAWKDLNEITRVLDEFYLVNRLKLMCEIESYKKRYSTEQNEPQIDPTKELLKPDSIRENPMIAIQYSMLLTISNEREEDFKELLSIFDKYYLDIPKNELLSLYSTITNFCIRKIVQGHSNYAQTLFSIYKKQAEQRVLSNRKYVSGQLVKNIVSLSATIGEFKWAEDFLKLHINDVKPDSRDSVYHYNKAILAFYQKDFKTAMEHLNQTEKIDLSFELGRKTVLLRTYYELKEGLAFDALCKSFREYVHSQNGMPTRLKKAYVNFTTVIRKIERIRQQGEHGKILPLIEKINNYEFLTNKPWLIEKLKELPAYKRALAEETVDD